MSRILRKKKQVVIKKFPGAFGKSWWSNGMPIDDASFHSNATSNVSFYICQTETTAPYSHPRMPIRKILNFT